VRLAIALGACLIARSALAGPAEEKRALERELARQRGEQAAARRDFPACAAAFLEAFEIDSRDRGDEYLYNAGICFEEDAEVDRALEAWRRLARLYPRSHLRPRALVRSGVLLAVVARFEEAAAAFEEYATQHGGEKDARDAMSNAALYRLGLGHHRRAIELTRRWLKTYKHTPAEEARGLLFIAAAQEEMGDRRAAIRSLEQAVRLTAGRDPDGAGRIRARLAALKKPAPRARPAAPPLERFDRRGVAADILVTAPLAP
jgi:tetratricopeptide (TPR) repeat protein